MTPGSLTTATKSLAELHLHEQEYGPAVWPQRQGTRGVNKSDGVTAEGVLAYYDDGVAEMTGCVPHAYTVLGRRCRGQKLTANHCLAGEERNRH